MRAFDVLSRAEVDIRGAVQPRHHFEMALLKWMHLRRLVPLTELLAGNAAPPAPPARPAPAAVPPTAPAPRAPSRPRQPAPPPRPAPPPADSAPPGDAAGEADPKAAVLAEIKRAKRFFYGTVVAQAQRIDLVDDRLVFAFTASQQTLAAQLAQGRGWLEDLASKVVGRKVKVAAEQEGAPPRPAAEPAPDPSGESQRELKMAALDDEVVQALLEVFPAEIRDIEKIDP